MSIDRESEDGKQVTRGGRITDKVMAVFVIAVGVAAVVESIYPGSFREWIHSVQQMFN